MQSFPCDRLLHIINLQRNVRHPWHLCYYILLSSSSPTTYVMEEDEPSFLEAIDYSAESNDEDAEPENEHASEVHEIPDHLEQLSDSETNHRD